MNSRFQSRVVLTGYIKCKSGAKLEKEADSKPNSPDLYTLKDLSGMPYISGSNFKTFLRRQVESLLKETLGPGFSCDSFNREKACIRLGERSGEQKSEGGIYLQDLLDRFGEDDEGLIEAVEKHTCIACKLFGSQLVESQIVSEDLKPSAWGGQFTKGKRRAEEESEDEPASIPDKFMIRVVLNNCEPWKRGLFIMGLSRAQNKLITLSTGRQAEQHIATIDELSVRSLESSRALYERLSKFEATDGVEVTTAQLQHWIASLRDYLKLVAGYALAS